MNAFIPSLRLCSFISNSSNALVRPRITPRPHPVKWLCSSSQFQHTPSNPQISFTSTAQTESLYNSIKRAPKDPGIYRFLDANGGVLYVGKAKILRSRVQHYVVHDSTTVTGVSPSTNVNLRIATMIQEARAVDFIVTDTESAALALEASMVAEMRPKYNVLLKDDRRHPFALITFSEEYPRIILSRNRKKKHKQDRLYGPFVNEARLRRILNVIHTIFPLRQRPKRLFQDRPCINYDLGRCPGVCQKLISSEEYTNTVEKVDKLLKGRVDEVLQQLRHEMNVLSEAMLYEKAAQVRDRIAALEDVFYGDQFDTDSSATTLLKDAEAASRIVSQNVFQARDIFAIAHNDTVAKVILFQIRGGKVISRLVFSPDSSIGATSEEMLSTVLSSHYADISHPMEVPEEVVLAAPASDMNLLKDILTEKRGKAVSVKLPGPKAKLLAQIVEKNAKLELDIQVQRANRVVRDLQVLEEMLEPYSTAKPQFSGSLSEKSEEDLNEGLVTKIEMEGSTTRFKRIECYDISHTSGANAVGSMAVFIEGFPALAEYRRFYLDQTVSYQGHPDDYESIKETLRRRFKNIMNTNRDVFQHPDLVIIDGGKGQLSAAVEVFDEYQLSDIVPVISIAKAEEAIFVPNHQDPINMDYKTGSCTMNDGVRLICRLRDEAHRTAVTAHRKRRGKQALRSGLDSVPGLGRVKRDALLEHFNGSSEAISKASTNMLQEVPGIGPGLAKKIYKHFHSSDGVVSTVSS